MADFSKGIKRRFNIVDFLLILLVIAIIGIGIWQFWKNTQVNQDTNHLRVTIRFENVDNEIVTHIKNDLPFSAVVNKTYLGTLVEFSVMPQKKPVVGEVVLEDDIAETTVMEADSQLLSTVSIVLDVTGLFSENSVTVGSVKLELENKIAVFSSGFAGEGVVTAIEEVR